MIGKIKLSFRMLITLAVIGVLSISAAPSRAAGSYTVQSGDTLFSIAARFDVSISELATINRVYDVNAIYVGELLLLPNPLPPGYYPTYPVYTPPPVYNVPIAPIAPIYSGGTLLTTYRSYVVQPGDFLSAIASRFGTSADAILSANNISDPNLLYIGQTLRIPTSRIVAVLPPPPVRPIYGNFYTVQPGDTLEGIGLRFNRDIYNIARVNGLLNLNAIYAGMALLIP